MNLGVFYQSGYKLVACYMALQQLRKVYPLIPIALYEDGSNLLEDVAKEFNCAYKKTDLTGENFDHSGRPVTNLDTNLAWLKRIHQACETTLKDCEYIVLYEDDVWCRREIKTYSKFDLAGANGPLYTSELYQYLKNKFNIQDESRNHWSNLGSLQSYGACGGTIFKRIKFIEAYNKINEIEWQTIEKLDTRPLEWSDASLSFIMQHAGLSCGIWEDWGQYDTQDKGKFFDKTGWSIPMEEQEDKAFLHAYKHFYNYRNEELDLAKKKLV